MSPRERAQAAEYVAYFLLIVLAVIVGFVVSDLIGLGC